MTLFRFILFKLLILTANMNFMFHGQADASMGQHGFSVFGCLKYSPNFTNFNYVNPNAPKQGKIKLGSLGTFDSLNPYIIKGTAPEGIIRCHATLLAQAYDEIASHYGYVAHSLEVAPDGSWVIFHLNPKACFSDGTPLTADDVLFSFEILRQKGLPLYRSYYQAVSRVEKLSSHQVKFCLKSTKSRELVAILGQIPVFSKAFYDQIPFDQTSLTPPPCSGPYTIARVEAGRSLTYQRVPGWWGQNLPSQKGCHNFETIQVDFYRDPTAMFEAFKNGELDMRIEMSAKTWVTDYHFPAFEKGYVKKYSVQHQLSYGSYGLYFNTRRALFKDRLVRMALTEMFDFNWLNKNLLYNQYKRNITYFPAFPFAALGLPDQEERALLEPYKNELPPELFNQPFTLPNHETVQDINASRTKALELLKRAGWVLKDQKLVNIQTGQPFVFEFLINNPMIQKIALHFQNYLKKIGIEMKVTLIDVSTYQERYDRQDYDMILHVIPQSPTPGNEQRDMWSTAAASQAGTWNVSGIKNPVIDALIEKIIESPDYETLIVRTRALDRVLLWGYYMIPAWHQDTVPIAVWDRFGFPNPMCPPYAPTSINSWWFDSEKNGQLIKGDQKVPSQSSLWNRVKKWLGSF